MKAIFDGRRANNEKGDTREASDEVDSAHIHAGGDKITNNHTTINEGPASNVSVRVNGWRCGVRDYVNNVGPGRFSSERAFRAELVFEYINGLTHLQFTDDSSEVSLVLPDGPYRIIVKSHFTRPDTFYNVLVPRDSALEVDVVYEFERGDSLYVEFWYPIAGDSLGQLEERSKIGRLNHAIGNKLALSPLTVRQTMEGYGPGLLSSYFIPIRWYRPIYTYEVIDTALAVLRKGHLDGTFPASMAIKGVGYYCLQ